MLPFGEIENAILQSEVCLASLTIQEPQRTEVEAIIVAGLVVKIVSEYEQLIERIFVERAGMAGDLHILNFIRISVRDSFRSPDLKKINDTLLKFSADKRDAFWSDLENTKAHAAWDNIMRARHAVVHKRGSLNLTASELKTSYLETKVVLRKLVAVLGIPPTVVPSF